MCSSPPNFTLLRLHHVKIPSTDLDKSIHFFTSTLGGRYVPELDHRQAEPNGLVYAKVVEFDMARELAPLKVELRLVHHEGKTPLVQWNFLTFAVESRNELEQWVKHFDENKIEHSPIMRGLVGHVLAVDDGMGNRIQFYTTENTIEPAKPEEITFNERWTV